MNKTPVTPQTDYPKSNIPYRVINHPFRFGFIVPGKGITIEKDSNGILYISSESGMDVADLVAGDNIELTRTEDGKIIVSAVNTVADVSAGQNVSIDIDPETGSAIINVDTGGDTSEHYKGVFDTAQDLIDYDSNPEIGDYGLIKNLTFTDGGDATWSGQYKYCFFINGMWTVVDQMLTFTNNTDLIQQFFSVGGSSPVIYLHEVARTGDFNSLKNVPIVATPEVTVEGTTITVTCATEGADIYYTTDGTMPHVTATKYTGPLTATGPTNYRFVGVKNGMINSLEALASADYDLQEPVFNLDYTTGAITIENPNLDGNNDPVGAIYYTTDGSTPTDQSTLYTDPIMAPDVPSYTVKAIVIDSGNNLESDVATKTYPRIGAGSFGRSTNWITNVIYLTLRASNNATIHYSTDGSTPSYQSPGGATAVVSTQIYVQKTVKYRSFCEGYLPSSVMSYTIGYAKPSAPSIVFDSETNTVTINRTGETLSINISNNNDNKICYTTDGSTPTAQSTQYTGPFPVTNGMTVKAIFVAYGEYLSDVSALEVTILKMPSSIFNSNTGTLTLTDLNPGGVIHYTTDGSTPTAESTQYVSPIVLTEDTVVKCISVVENVGQSKVAVYGYEQATQPVITQSNLDLSTGNYEIVISADSKWKKIHYTLDGSTPTYQSPVFSNAISKNIFDGQVTVKAIVIYSEQIPSGVATETFGESAVSAPEITVDNETNKVTIELAGNTAEIPLQTNNNVPDMGARIYYTTDGSTPTDQSTLYTGNPFTLPEGVTTIKAITVCYGEFNSDVTTEEISGGGGTYGVRFAKNSDSADGTRVGDMTLHESLPIQSGMKRCLLLDNGTVNYYLDPDDSTKKADGTAADLTGADGQYMVEIPEFYAALLETDDYVEFSVSTDPVEGYFHYPTMYVSADEACLDRATGKLAAVVNDTANYRGGSNDDSKDADPYLTLLQRPVSKLSWQDFLDAAQLRGSGWCNYMNMVNSALYFLFITEYATRNTQKEYNPALTAEGYRQGGLGPDVTEFHDWFDEPFIPTGYTASLGNNTGVKDYTLQWEEDGMTHTHTAHVSSYRGVSVPIGHLAKAASGYFIRATSAEDVYAYFRNNPDTMSYEPVAGDISVRVPLTIEGQLVSKLGFAGGNLYPAEATGDPISDPTQPLTTYYCDGAFVYGSDMASEIYDPDSPVSSVPGLGGNANSGSYCGFAFAAINHGPSSANPLIGSRLCFISNN